MLVFTALSSMKTSFAGVSLDCCSRHSTRALATSSRACSAAWRDFFLGWQNELVTGLAFRRFPPGGADGQDINPRATGSGRGSVAYAEGLSGLRPPDAPALRQRPHPGDAGGPGAAAAEDPALRKGRLRVPSPSLSAGGGRRDGSAGTRVRPGRDCLGGEAASSRASQRAGDPQEIA